jgi:hypothetical protein
VECFDLDSSELDFVDIDIGLTFKVPRENQFIQED